MTSFWTDMVELENQSKRSASSDYGRSSAMQILSQAIQLMLDSQLANLGIIEIPELQLRLPRQCGTTTAAAHVIPKFFKNPLFITSSYRQKESMEDLLLNIGYKFRVESLLPKNYNNVEELNQKLSGNNFDAIVIDNASILNENEIRKFKTISAPLLAKNSPCGLILLG